MEALTERVTVLRLRAPRLADGVAAAVDLARIDPSAGLNRVRREAEAVLAQLCLDNAVGWGHAQPTLERMLGPLVAHGVLPPDVAAHVRTIQAYTSPASHHQERPFSERHFQLAALALIDFLMWHTGHAEPHDQRPGRGLGRRLAMASLLVTGLLATAAIALVVLSEPVAVGGGRRRCPSDMVFIPAGSYSVVLSGQGLDEEESGETVSLEAYCIDTTEVTVDAYFACYNAATCPTPADGAAGPELGGDEALRWSAYCNANQPSRGTHPMNCVDWASADRYCEWKHGRLPTESEWNVAATGGRPDPYPWGAQPVDATRANLLGGGDRDVARAMLAERALPHAEPAYTGADGWVTTAPVGSFPSGASRFGVLDLVGNVSEWTASSWNGSSGSGYVVRGSGWTYAASPRTRLSYRRPLAPTSRNPVLGFRCAANPR